MAGSARDKFRESLQRAQSDLLVFVSADDVPTERFFSLVALLERHESRDWAFAKATALDDPVSTDNSAYGRYRKLLEELPQLPCVDFALFDQSDATAGVVCIRRAALERIVPQLPDLPFSVRAVAIHAALESSPAMLDAEAVARPASGFERDRAATAPLLAMAFEKLLADEARNTNAPMPGQWGCWRGRCRRPKAWRSSLTSGTGSVSATRLHRWSDSSPPRAAGGAGST